MSCRTSSELSWREAQGGGRRYASAGRKKGLQTRPPPLFTVVRGIGFLRNSLVPGLLALSARLLNPTSYLSSASVSYPIPRGSRVGAPFEQAGFSGRGNARRSPSHRASTRGPLEQPGTRPSGRLLRRSPRRAPRRGDRKSTRLN